MPCVLLALLAVPPFLYAVTSHGRGMVIINNSNPNPKQRSGMVFVGADRKAHLTQPAPEAKHSAGVLRRV